MEEEHTSLVNGLSLAAERIGSFESTADRHRTTGVAQLDRVLGGGLVPGSAILVGGEPGVGKSTLLLQVAGAIADAGRPTLMSSAEESQAQIAMRGRRIGVAADNVLLTSSSSADDIIATAEAVDPALVVVDSIQTVVAAGTDGAAGGVAQVRECGARLVAYAKRSGVPVVLVGHVTKDGAIAGPRVLEHIVDVALYLEGDPQRGIRMLRGLKNRFGVANEVGFFEMTEKGLIGLSDPARALVDHWGPNVAGTVLFPSVEGKRPLVVEVQALVATETSPSPRRSVRGIGPARLHQLLAVLDRHAGLSLHDRDVYVSVVGGVRIREPGADLPLALALTSSALDLPVSGVAAWGEVGLAGELRAVARSRERQREADRLGIGTTVGANAELRTLVEALQVVGLHRAPAREPASVLRAG
jgi:DNA repair protein RadA/Sms